MIQVLAIYTCVSLEKLFNAAIFKRDFINMKKKKMEFFFSLHVLDFFNVVSCYVCFYAETYLNIFHYLNGIMLNSVV